MTAQEADGPLQCAVCAGIQHSFSAVKASSVITKRIVPAIDFFGQLLCCSDPSHVIIVLTGAFTLKQCR